MYKRILSLLALTLTACGHNHNPAPESSASASATGLESCGLTYVKDSGGMSIWKATRYASVGVMTQGSGAEGVVNMKPGDFIHFRIGTQSARCL